MLVQQIIHRHNAEDIPGGLLFIDFAHAYDYISQEFILKVMEKMNFPANFTNLLQTMFAEQKGKVIVNKDTSPIFPVNNGGKQGDPLFPLIYVIVVEALTALLRDDPNYQGITVIP